MLFTLTTESGSSKYFVVIDMNEYVLNKFEQRHTTHSKSSFLLADSQIWAIQ